MVEAEGSSPGGHLSNIYSAMIFISVLVGLIDFSDIVMLRSGPNSCCQQNLKCFDNAFIIIRLSFGQNM